MTTTREEIAEDNRQEGGRSAGVGYMRKAALVIGCGDLDLPARIASNWSEGGGFKPIEGGD